MCVALSFKTGTIKRVVRSTLSAEGYAVSETAELVEERNRLFREKTDQGRIRGGDPRTEPEKMQNSAMVRKILPAFYFWS